MSWSWKQIHQPIVFSNIELAKNGGSAGIMKLMAEDSKDAMLALEDKLGTALYTAQAGDSMDSLVDGCDDSSNVDSYAGITRSTYTW